MDIAKELAEIDALESDRVVRNSFLQQLNQEHSASTNIYSILAEPNQTTDRGIEISPSLTAVDSSAVSATIVTEAADNVFDDRLLWCEECKKEHDGYCYQHPLNVISDKVIPSHARLTLPNNFVITRTSSGDETVVCKKLIKNRTQFGPLIGTKIKNTPDCQRDYTFKIFSSQDCFEFLDTSDENSSNWMMFIKQAQNISEQNLVAYQYKSSIYFCSISRILPGKELKFGFAESYANLLGVKTLKHKVVVPTAERSVIIKDGYPCDTCDTVFNEFEELDGHMCPEEADRASSKGRRTRNKRKGKPQKLGLSPPKSTSQIAQHDKKDRKLNTRPRKYSPVQIVKCGSCDLVFNTRRRLAIHMYIHTGEYPYKCDQNDCAKSFNSKFKLDRHRLTHGSRDFTCTHCGKGFARKDNLQAHVIIHDNNRQSFKCTYEECTKEYNSKASFKVHTAIHEAEKGTRICMLCKTTFDDRDVLIKHIKVHAGSQQIKGIMEKKHKCSICDKRFFASKDQQRHMLTHTKEKHFECHLCPMRFGRSDHLKRHLTKIHPNGEKDCRPRSSKGNKKFEPVNEMTASDLTKSIQQLLAESNLNLDSHTSSMTLSNDYNISGSTVQITPYAVSSSNQRMVVSQPSHHDLTFSAGQPVQTNQTNSIGQRVGINNLIHNLSGASQSDGSFSNYVKPVAGNWQTLTCGESNQKYLLNADSSSVRANANCQPTMILIPEGHSQITNIDQLQRTAGNIIDTSHVLQSDTLCTDYGSDGLKVLNGLTPIFLNQDVTSSDNEYIPVVYQSTYNQPNQQ